MNLSWSSQNSPGFVYFDSSTSTDFIPFDSTSTPTKPCEKLTNNSPFNRGRKQRFYNNYNNSNNSNNSCGSNNKNNSNISFDNSCSPINRSWNKIKWNSFENSKNDSYTSPYNRKNNTGGSYNQRSINSSKGNYSKSFSFNEDCKQKNQYDIKMYVHPSFLENPWEELEKQHEEKKQSSLSDQWSS